MLKFVNVMLGNFKTGNTGQNKREVCLCVSCPVGPAFYKLIPPLLLTLDSVLRL